MGIACMLDIRQIKYEISSRLPMDLHMDIPTVTLRGAFGYSLAQILEADKTILSHEDKHRIFKDLFKPENTDRPSANSDPARPYVMRGAFSRPDRKSFILEFCLFGETHKAEPLFDKVVSNMSKMGLGRKNTVCHSVKLSSARVTPYFPPSSQIIVEFITPTRLKSAGQWFNDEIPFKVLFSRLIDRLKEIALLYGGQFHDLCSEDAFSEIKRFSEGIFSEKLEGGRFNTRRISGRTSEEIKLDGFIGKMLYMGDFSPFADILAYLPWIGVGKSAALGCGWVTINCITLK